MTRRWVPLLLPGLMLLILAGPVHAQPSAWWKSDQVRRDLALTTDQFNRIEAIFQAALPNLRNTKNELDRQEAELSHLIEGNSDEATVTKQIDRAEAVRASLNKMRTLMLVHMRDVLTAEQRVKFKALHDRRDRDRNQKNRDDKDRDRRRPPQ
jgi:Spy/CpxP family protein refolding chaperone